MKIDCYCLFIRVIALFHWEYFIKKFVCEAALLHVKWEFLQTLLVSYYHMKICISLQQFHQTIYERVIALFHLEYFIKNCKHNPFYILIRNSLKLCNVFSLPHEDLFINTAVIRQFWRSYCPFWLRIFH